jgi:lysozyme
MYAVDIVVARLTTEEGYREFPYNDKTGARVSCLPDGNLTWLYGLNLETAGSPELGRVILTWWVDRLHGQLLHHRWYNLLDQPRRSVMLDIAYNEGLAGLLGFHEMIAALEKDPPSFATASAQLLDSEAARAEPTRYAALAQILATGAL